jgi:serine/threonine protein kinase
VAESDAITDELEATTRVTFHSASAELDVVTRSELWRGTARYEVVRLLGEGGMGTVYEVFDRELERSVALKTVRKADAASVYRFKQEFRTLADVQHPNLVHLYEFVATEAGEIFFTMELVRGAPFLRYVKDGQGTVDYGRLRSALRQVVEGVLVLHTAGKLHRDIKPSNVLVTPEGRVVILDFGVAAELSIAADRFSGEREVVGTAPYMAPEQILSAVPHPASDWYSVGVMLYAALVGAHPFVGNAREIHARKLAVDPTPPRERMSGLPADLDALCMALLSRVPEMRPTGPEILRRLGGPTAANDPSHSRSHVATKLVGRENHLRALRRALEATQSGQIVLFVSGLAGMGKSSLIRQFLDEQASLNDAFVLRGRAYERESVPFKAIDAVIDSLSVHLLRSANEGKPVNLPADVGVVAKIFPVLGRVPGISDASAGAELEPMRERRQAFVAIRELVASTAANRPIIVYVDDAQWGDADSAALLLELLRPPALRMLLLVSYRENETNNSPFLRELRARLPHQVNVRELEVGPLSSTEAERLAFELLGADERSRRFSRSVALESGGSPFLIEELVCSLSDATRHEASIGALDFSAVTLDQMVSERSRKLPEEARRLLEVVAIEGRPVPVSIVASAAGVVARSDELLGLLRSQRFVRCGLREGHEVVEMSHDRVRETLAGQLSVEVTREHHHRLAQVHEATSNANPEVVAAHLFGAGEAERGAKFAEVAAEQATSKLAFERAAQLFRMVTAIVPASHADGRRLRLRLARVLEWAGRGTEAARVYEEVARFAPDAERTSLERAAAEQLLTCGRIDEGAAVLRRVLAAVDLRAPGSSIAAVGWLVLYRVWLHVRGLGFRSRAETEIGQKERLRLDALFTVALGFGSIDVVLSACMTAWSLVAALRAGERRAIQRAATLQMSLLSGSGGIEGRHALALERTARSLVETDPDAEAQAFFRSNIGVSHYCRGRWNAAVQELDSVLRDFPAHRAGMTSNVNVFCVCSLVYAGRIRELRRRLPRLITEAEERGDLFMLAHMRASHPIVAWLAADDPDGARRHAKEGMAQWPRVRFVIQHWQAMLAEAQIALYEDDGATAYERVVRDSVPLRRSLLLNAQIIRGLTDFVRGRAALASIGESDAPRRRRLSEARRMARRLRREGMAWTTLLSSMLDASIANACGDAPRTMASLRACVELARSAEMPMHGAAASRRLGALLGGERGDVLIAEADAAMVAEDIVAPARWSRMLVPGQFGRD